MNEIAVFKNVNLGSVRVVVSIRAPAWGAT